MRRAMWTAAAVLVLAGCGSGQAGTSPAAASGSGDAVLAARDSPLGAIVVDADGRAVYVFDHDTAGSGTSACTGQCLQNWPPVTTDDDSPAVDGVTATVGTIDRADGTRQLTLDGRPLHRFAGDAEPGQLTGQGVQGVWWLVAPDGTAVRTSAAPPVPGY